MLTLTRAVRVHAWAAPIDMRRGFDGLSALVEQQLGKELLKGDVFLFTGRCRRKAKVLYFDGTGLVLLSKRLFKGRFARPWVEEGQLSVELTVAELSLFLEGCELAGRWQLSPPAFEEKELALTS
ncbi:MAG: IS66 family insertion sequence element accessory protein TnpB [Myxococcaceae bacterium]|nr:IS66 family insertion sequence element accessory protein TnpB [Myxococcaceae bacterium]MCI0673095.1 IS66 family insertion sequence element accessory protein TnpB [Myxococcaceae bacterium]